MKLLLPEFGLVIWTLVAFLVVYFILKKFAWPAIIKGLDDREKKITDSLATAERVQAEMAQLKNENEIMLAKAREESAQVIKEARDAKDRIINEAKEQAKVEAARIIEDANVAIEQRKMAVLIDIKNHMGAMVIDMTEKVLKRELANPADQEKFISQLTDNIKVN